jgi:hypothetical protein
MKTVFILLITFFLPAFAFSQFITKYPDLPRIDVHSHVHNNYQGIANYLSLRDKMLTAHRIDLAMWINLGGESGIDTINEVSGGRIMTCISDYSPHRGLKHTPEDIANSIDKGYIGYKIWHGPYQRVQRKTGEITIKYFDDPAHEPVLRAMEKAGLPGASIHIADPNGPFGDRGKWAADPVEFWRQIIGLERVLQRHPDLVLVVAHGAWLVCQDAQLDFLRYLFSTYPNFYVDLAATFQYFYLVDHANLRELIIEYSDRILYGTDIGNLRDQSAIPNHIERYNRTFRILETDQMVEGGFFGMNPVMGLDLPKEVLEKIYYKNAARIYPGVADRMGRLGYKQALSKN